MIRQMLVFSLMVGTIVWTLCLRWLGIDRFLTGNDAAGSRVPGAPRGFDRSAQRRRFVPPALQAVLQEMNLPEALAARLSLLAYPDLPTLGLALEQIPPDALRERIGAAYGLLDALSGVPNLHLRAVLAHAFGPAWDVSTIWDNVRYEEINDRIAVARAQLEV